MQFALEIDTQSGGRYVTFGPADSPGHASALTLRDNWQTWRDTKPGAYFTVVDNTSGQSTTIHCGDMTDVRVRTPR